LGNWQFYRDVDVFGEPGMGRIVIDSFFPNLTMATLDGLAQYYETTESQLQLVKQEEYGQITSEIRSWKLSPEDESTEWDLAMQEHTARHDMLFTNFLRYSFVVLLFLVLENKLRELCEIIGKLKGKTPPAAQRDIVKQYKRFLEDAGVSIAQQVWESVHDLNKVRNCIVHASGNVARTAGKEYLRILARRDPGLAISGYDYEGNDSPLYLEENMLVLTPDYCSRAVADVRRLFDDLCHAVPLRGIVFEERAK
jgi:hypothetical protein